jgi:hypothetical protein
MTDISNRNTVASPAPALRSPACLRSAPHNAILVHYRIDLPNAAIEHLAKATSVRPRRHQRLSHHLQQHFLLFKSP